MLPQRHGPAARRRSAHVHTGLDDQPPATAASPPVLIELARSADVLLCEAGFLDQPGLPPSLHLTGRQAGRHASAAGAGHLILTHLDPDNDPALSLAEAQSTFKGPISLAAPGQVLSPGQPPPGSPPPAR